MLANYSQIFIFLIIYSFFGGWEGRRGLSNNSFGRLVNIF